MIRIKVWRNLENRRRTGEKNNSGFKIKASVFDVIDFRAAAVFSNKNRQKIKGF